MDRIYTGFESLDKHLKIYKGDLVVIGSRPAIGKTSLMCSMIEKTIEKQKTLFFTMEERKDKNIEKTIFKVLDLKENVKVINKEKIIYRFCEALEKKYYNLTLCREIVGIEELILCVAECKIKENIGIVFIDNFYNLVSISNTFTSEIIILLKELSNKLNVAIVIADSHRVSGKKYSYYLDLRHKSLIKYADKIITINRPDRTATEKEIRDGLIEKGVAEIRIDKDMEEYFSPLINLKFDNNSLTFNEIPKTPWFIATVVV